MGSVALAGDTRLADKLVVIKELIADPADPTEDVRNFKYEVQTLAHLDHPLIPGVTDHFQEGSCYFLVQEYVEGENLEARMERIKRPMEEQDALRYATEVLDILDYLEQQTAPLCIVTSSQPISLFGLRISGRTWSTLALPVLTLLQMHDENRRRRSVRQVMLHQNNTRDMLSRARTSMH